MNQLLNKVLLKIYLSTIYASLIQIISAHLAESTANIKVGAYFAIYLQGWKSTGSAALLWPSWRWLSSKVHAGKAPSFSTFEKGRREGRLRGQGLDPNGGPLQSLQQSRRSEAVQKVQQSQLLRQGMPEARLEDPQEDLRRWRSEEEIDFQTRSIVCPNKFCFSL